MSLADTLITNRPRGAVYDYRDLNRVENALAILRDMLQNYGADVIINLHGEWKNGDNFTEQNAQQYLDNVSIIRSALPMLSTTPPVPPDMDKMTAVEANNIEKILTDVETLLIGWEKDINFSWAIGIGYTGLHFTS